MTIATGVLWWLNLVALSWLLAQTGLRGPRWAKHAFAHMSNSIEHAIRKAQAVTHRRHTDPRRRR